MATVRAVRSVGALATSEKALSVSLMAWPRPLVPPTKMFSICATLSARAASSDLIEAVAVACLVRNSS
jgi:hypothetical protein